jgi:D-glycero-alpha-D-manno-heptose-7-phosphate kinase
MIISRTPLRISFAGGGSDLPAFYRRYGGAVLSTAIDKYVFVTVNKKFDNGIRVAYSQTEEVDSVDRIQHSLVRASLRHVEIDGGVEITTIADIPSRGTGLGSSSAFTVALLHGLYAVRGAYASAQSLAEQACHIEIDVCGEPIGKQDQYAAAIGGFNLIEFHPNETVTVSPIICQPDTLTRLGDSLLLLYTGITRSASDLLREQSAGMDGDAAKRSSVQRMVELCFHLRNELQANNLTSFGDILHEGWVLKRGLASRISSDAIDTWYETARKHGARGGKILGAGAGGFLLLTAPPDRHQAICHALPQLRPIPFQFERWGSQIIFYQPGK